MSKYRHIMLATDLSPASDAPAARAKELAALYGASLSVLNVVEYVPPGYIRAELPRELATEDALVARARGLLQKWVLDRDIDASALWVEVGPPKHAIVEAAKAHGVELIVVGTHGAHGLDLLLLGSTATGVLHRAPCDVLTVSSKPS